MASTATQHFIEPAEIEALKAAVDDIRQGGAGFYLIKGDFGSGKSLLVDILSKQIKTAGANVVFTEAREGDLDFDTLRRGFQAKNLEDYIDEKPTNLNYIIVVNDTGIALGSQQRGEYDLDADIMGSMTSAVNDFVKESFQAARKNQEGKQDFVAVNIERGFDEYQHKDQKVGVFRYKLGKIICMVEGEISEALKQDLHILADHIETNYSDLLANWTGDMNGLELLNDSLSELINKYTGELPELDPASRRFRTYSRLMERLEKNTQSSKLALVLDDADLADTATLKALDIITKNIRKNILVVATSEKSAEELGLKNFETIELGGFDTAKTKELLKAQHPETFLFAEDDLIKYIQESTNGNPLVINENGRLFDKLDIDIKNWNSALEAAGVEILKTPDDVITHRIKSLGDKSYCALELAAILGQEFDAEFLEKITGGCTIDPNEIEIIERLNGTYRFRDSRTRDALLSKMDKKEEKFLSVAQTLESLIEDKDDKIIHDLAKMYTSSSNKEKAIEYLKKSAELFEINAHYLLAAKQYKTLLNKLDAGSEAHLQMLKKVNDFASILDFENSFKYATEWLTLAEDCDDKKEQVDALNQLARHCTVCKKVGELKQYTNQAISISQQIKYGLGEFWAQHHLSQICLVQKSDLARTAGKRALELAKDIGDDALLYFAYGALGNIASSEENFSDFLYYAEKAVDASRGNRYAGNALLALGFALQKNKRFDEATSTYEKVKVRAEKAGNLQAYYTVMQNIAEIHAEKGELEKAISLYEECLDAFEKMGAETEVSSCKIELCLLHARLADNYKKSASEKPIGGFAKEKLNRDLPDLVKNLSSG